MDGGAAVDGAAGDRGTSGADSACGSLSFIETCDVAPASGGWTISTAETLDTGIDPRCAVYSQAGGPDACLVHVTSFDITSLGSLRATGSRPLIVLADGKVTIAGTLDVSSYRPSDPGAGSDDQACTPGESAEEDPGGAAGGAGGSFGDVGGSGGEGDNDDSLGDDGTAVGGQPGSATVPTLVRGGCPGGSGGDESENGGAGGSGGSSGGGLFIGALGAIEITATGLIRATGAGGEPGQVQAGGGGGGSGGMIGLEASAIAIDGILSANGGSGGGGGARISGIPTTGGPGNDGTVGLTGATGGDGASPMEGEGDGGVGSGGATTSGGMGVASRVGAGGGGGSRGVILIVGDYTGTGQLTPSPQQP